MTKRELQSIKLIFNNVLVQRGCLAVQPVPNQLSVSDAFLFSGSSTGVIMLPLEMKERHCKSYQYNDNKLDYSKINNLQKLAWLIRAPIALLASEYEDGIIAVWVIDPYKSYAHNESIGRVSTDFANTERTLKDCVFLPLSEASIVVSKKTWNEVTQEQFQNYIMVKRKEERERIEKELLD